VSLQNIKSLISFLFQLPTSKIRRNQQGSDKSDENETSEFLIDCKFEKENKTILAGSVVKGKLKRNDIVYMGPDEEGLFK
jgi:GTPase